MDDDIPVGLVEDMSGFSAGKEWTAAWLRGFDVDRAGLKPRHKAWIERKLVKSLLADASGDLKWWVWIVGATSRTGSISYNAKLSRKRGEAIASYVTQKVAGLTVEWNPLITAASELPAIAVGREDEVENFMDRAVFVAATRSKRKPPPPPHAPPKPVPVRVRFHAGLNQTQFWQFKRWTGWLGATTRNAGRYSIFWWPLSATGIGIDPSVVTISKTPPSYGEASIFAGYVDMEFKSVYDLDRIATKYISLGVLGSKLRIKVSKGRPSGKDLELTFPHANIELELSQSWSGSTGRTQLVSKNDMKKVFFPVWTKGRWMFMA